MLPGPNWLARWSREGRAVYEAESGLMFVFFPAQGVPIRREKLHQRGWGIFCLSEGSVFIFFIVFAVLCCAFSHISKEKKNSPT